MTITNANIRFNENGTPYATEFEDLYFSDAQGIDETTHVFVKNNKLLERWKEYSEPLFTIAETGFGTGLNVLVTILYFEKFMQQVGNPAFRLHFISIEKFPISHVDLAQALSLYPQLEQYSQPLLEQYPIPVEGCHRLSFLGGKVILDLWLGDVHNVLPKIENKPQGLVDTWFLDGFAPSKNPEMWTQSLFENMALLAKDQCHFATFTAAGHVKRGLREAGFTVEKQPGHGRKRDMLAGSIDKSAENLSRLPYFTRIPATMNKTPKIAIIGGGLAGANCAYALSKRGLQATLYCQDDDLAQGASGNAQGGFYPQLNAEAGHASQIHALAFNYASKLYKQLFNQGIHYSHQWCGTIQLAFNDKVASRYHKLINNQTWPESLVHWIDAKQATTLANLDLPYPGLYIPQGGWINLPELVSGLVKAADSKVETNKQLTSLERFNGAWQLNWQDGGHTDADIVIMATGSDSADCEQMSQLPFRLVRGQVENINSQNQLADLATVLCHKGYLTPAWQGSHALGSTYIKDDKSCDYRLTEQHTNLAMHQQALTKCDWIHDIQATTKGRAAIRCSTPDHLPMVGAVPESSIQTQKYHDLYKALPAKHYPQPINHTNLFMLCGLGSRGLTTAPLCAEILVSQILDEPLPLANQLLDALNPNRFLVRGLIRRQG
ncbi:bifunctional tRNA (5-methylaminomethyl-2-thiouridine)(34)-methyltransferase MnmD/FAD-dependent 5-carboxymethylaminomethyl-2-thiouridine(34) oxidoreductase MnmC [Paraglaciecola arctica]|uniref:tRNA 5-methylaminomethyl-2-thiouridine biosynthesis bifunctional protein MnmC n=1 Tax=Paraglaciecola arctica BSs20135 TaxID=493475 RepID=K6Z1Z6_9ALTE|nr:bifunctional tRNA (5-methylaminomethyl-2-thiouridine)(34)-methyltransferase MnmD/FAD-dependent 5-carboxymethylaminomethyl-2-thiouridine(34) oxidoreductase MnmC [Paraglaciecola arctica]GAC17480.1 tRNA 5-methylaminomethyl-2-thiouridine biosynthesis bifunctional protein [Paraglaciecola arctica BSs20135]